MDHPWATCLEYGDRHAASDTSDYHCGGQCHESLDLVAVAYPCILRSVPVEVEAAEEEVAEAGLPQVLVVGRQTVTDDSAKREESAAAGV